MTEDKEDNKHVVLRGKVTKVCRDKFEIEVSSGKDNILAQLSGKLRKNRIRVGLYDIVDVKVSVYDLTHGFIVSRISGRG